MDRERFQQVKQVFHGAVELSGDAREALLTRECAGDDELRREVDELLEHAREFSVEFLQQFEPPALESAPLQPERIPGFTLGPRLASGSSGVVYRATQHVPHREVALKLLRLDGYTPSAFARFRREADILAALSHPGIAKVFASGVERFGEDAQPWIAMELVEGATLGLHVSRERPDLRARLVLFRALCDAVEHAHARGVVHRDLKPSNVMVDTHGQPRVLDFGLARIRGSEFGSGPERTHTGTVLGTAAYMSPEQARGDNGRVDARSDVYSLGAMLFELATGRPPLQLDRLDLLDAVRTIGELEPPPPRALSPELPEDLDAITLKALEKDPQRRYPSAGALRDDLDNLLAERPVLARRPTVLYQARKFVFRHRVLTATTALVIAALGLALAIALSALRSEHRQLQETSAALDFVAAKMLALAPQLGIGEESRADLTALVEYIQRHLTRDPANRPLRATLAQLHYELASLDQTRGDLDGLLRNSEAARALREQLVREEPADIASWTHLSALSAKLGEVARDRGDAAGRDHWFERALEIDEWLAREHPDDLELVEDLGWSLARSSELASERGDHAEAERIALRRLGDAQRLVGREPEGWKYLYNLSHVRYYLAGMRELAGDMVAALVHVEDALARSRRALDVAPERRDLLVWHVHCCRRTAQLLGDSDPARSRALIDEALATAEQVAMAEPARALHREVLLLTAHDLATLERASGNSAGAERAASILRRVALMARGDSASPTPADLEAAAAALETGAPR